MICVNKQDHMSFQSISFSPLLLFFSSCKYIYTYICKQRHVLIPSFSLDLYVFMCFFKNLLRVRLRVRVMARSNSGTEFLELSGDGIVQNSRNRFHFRNCTEFLEFHPIPELLGIRSNSVWT